MPVKSLLRPSLTIAVFVWTIFIACIDTPAKADNEKTVSRQVLLPDGKPAIDAKVSLYSRNSLGVIPAERLETVTADQQGKFILQTETGLNYDDFLLIDSPDCAIAVFDSFGIGKEETPLRLSPDVGLQGQVVGLKNEPVANVSIVLTMVGANRYLPVRIQSPENILFPALTTQSKADGTFRLRSALLNDNGSSRGLQVEIWGSAQRDDHVWMGHNRVDLSSASLDAPKERQITTVLLEPTLGVRGRVLQALTGQPLAGAEVSHHGDYVWGRKTQMTDETGEFEFKHLPAGRNFNLGVSHKDFPGARVNARRMEEKNAVPGKIEEVTLEIRPVAKVSGIVVNADTGQPLPFRVSVHAGLSSAAGDNWSQSMGGNTTTFVSKGEFTFQAPVGEATFIVNDRDAFSRNGGAIEPQRFTRQIPPEGLENLQMTVRKQPGFLIHFTYETQENRPLYIIHQRTPEGERYLGSLGRLMFHKAAQWGETLEIRVVNAEYQEVLPWTKIVADPKAWPVIIPIP